MPAAERDQLIRLVPRIELAEDIGAFLIDREARGLSPRIVQFYKDRDENEGGHAPVLS